MNKIVWMIMLVALVAMIWPERVVERIDMPLYAAQAPPSPPASKGESAWLHVVVETKYAWIYQKSVGRAWTTVSRDDTTRTNVGELCIQLDCYDTQKVCTDNTSYVEIQEIKRRVAVKKKKAVVSAWANDPAIEKISVEMMP